MQLTIHKFFDRYAVLQQGDSDLNLLREIARAFSHLPYENVTKILKEAAETNERNKLRQPDEVLQDHLRWNTGGTCFSLCNTLQHILHSNGFDSWIAMADMHYGQNIHCAIVTSLASGRYLLDPGYLLHEPLLLPQAGMKTVRATQMNTIIIHAESEQVFSLYTEEAGQKKFRYRLGAGAVSFEEFTSHWLHSFSLNTMEHLLLTRLDTSGRIYFRKNRLERVNAQQREKQHFASLDASALSSLFGVPAELIHLADQTLSGRR